MNYTTNYHLPQWVEEDRILMEDFNQMCADIETALANTNSAIANCYAPNNKPYVIGTYRGTGNSTPTTITLGFRPALLIIAYPKTNGSFEESIITDGTAMTYRLAFTDTGFTAYMPGENSHNYPDLNKSHSYTYIAFR